MESSLRRVVTAAGNASMAMQEYVMWAKEAKAIYKVDKVVLVNCDLFEKYLETFRVDS